MVQIILIIVGIAIVVILLTKKTREQVAGICTAVMGLKAKKRENKEKILALIRERGEASNSDIREAPGVSASSAARYMDELEKEGKVEQVGNTGRSVIYRLR